jgi:hypothetical protein
MSYFQTKINLAEDVYIEPAKESTYSFEDQPVSNLIDPPTNHHSFNKWADYINRHFDFIISNTYNTCLNNCKLQVSLLSGRVTHRNPTLFSECDNECETKWAILPKLELNVIIVLI